MKCLGKTLFSLKGLGLFSRQKMLKKANDRFRKRKEPAEQTEDRVNYAMPMNRQSRVAYHSIRLDVLL